MKQKGKVNWFSNAKGYGFIESKQGDLFVHYSEINLDGYKFLEGGQLVEYEIKQTARGRCACNVTILES